MPPPPTSSLGSNSPGHADGAAPSQTQSFAKAVSTVAAAKVQAVPLLTVLCLYLSNFLWEQKLFLQVLDITFVCLWVQFYLSLHVKNYIYLSLMSNIFNDLLWDPGSRQCFRDDCR